jgi:hypothetical protein
MLRQLSQDANVHQVHAVGRAEQTPPDGGDAIVERLTMRPGPVRPSHGRGVVEPCRQLRELRREALTGHDGLEDSHHWEVAV